MDFEKTVLQTSYSIGFFVLSQPSSPAVSNREKKMEDSLYQYFELREKLECKDMAADWFHKKWGVPKEAYLECMTAYLEKKTEYGW